MIKDNVSRYREYFCTVYDYAGKADLNKGCWDPKRKIWVTTYFSEIIKQP